MCHHGRNTVYSSQRWSLFCLGALSLLGARLSGCSLPLRGWAQYLSEEEDPAPPSTVSINRLDIEVVHHELSLHWLWQHCLMYRCSIHPSIHH